MKYLFANLCVNLLAMLCAGGAIYLAVKGRDGWGWFLLVAVLCAASVPFNKNDDDDKEE